MCKKSPFYLKKRKNIFSSKNFDVLCIISTNLYSPYAHTEEGEAAQEDENIRQSQ